MNAIPRKTWTVAEAKARLSEILRLASEEGPQRIGTKTPYVVVPEEEWLKRAEPRIPLGRWLVENMPRIDDLELPVAHPCQASVGTCPQSTVRSLG